MQEQDSRRAFLKKTSILAIASIASPLLNRAYAISTVNNNLSIATTGAPFTLPGLPYQYNALEPFIDALTMEIHHSKHHQSYVDKLNKALLDEKITAVSLENLCKNASQYSPAIRNNAGGHYNHSLFWKLMQPNSSALPTGALATAITNTFGSFEAFKTQFTNAAKNQFGSGFTWLIFNKNSALEIGTTPNQNNPLMDISELKGSPVLAIDVWEHAYYLKYQNKRADYINAWWNVINWNEAEQNYIAAKQ